MNEFRKSVAWVTGSILIVLTFFRNNKWQIWIFTAIFLVWGMYLTKSLLLPQWKLWLTKMKNRITASKVSIHKKKPQIEKQDSPVAENELEHLLLSHVGCRITEKLHSAYPKATWQWCGQPTDIIHGQTCRIQTYNTGEFSHAEVTIGKYYKISFKMLKIVELEKKSEDEIEMPKSNTAPKVVDATVWYDLVGHDVLTALIEKLSVHGQYSLTIKEDGSIVYVNGFDEIKADELQELPPRQYWPELATCLEGDDLTTELFDDRIKVAWA